jgi:hypothetical protein
MKSITSRSLLRPFGWCFILLSIVLAAGCGGGGGSSGSGGGGGGGPTIAPTYTYSTFNQIVLSENNFSDYDVAAAYYRSASPAAATGCYVIAHDLADFKLRYDSELNAIVTIQNVARDCLTQSISGTPLDFAVTPLGGATQYPADFGGALSGFVAWDTWVIGIPDPGTLTETAFHWIEVGPYCDIQSNWMTTRYVCLGVYEINYANTCSYYIAGGCSYVNYDNTHDTDLLSGVTGDFTFAGDMPTAGTNGFRVKALAKYHADDGFNSRCGTHLISMSGPLECGPITRGALTADQFLTANFAAGTLTGSLDLDYDLYFESSVFAPTMTEDRRIGTLTFNNVQISGNSFSGEITSPNFEGYIKGHFFGPDGKEIGGVINFTDVPEGDYDSAYGVVAFAGAMN